MANLSQETIDLLTSKLDKYLTKKFGKTKFEYITSGGSAAIFKAEIAEGVRAFKVFDPKFLTGSSGAAEKKRLEVQRRLIAHTCPNLVETFEIEEAEDTAISEMEFVDWPQLKQVLKTIPDEKILNLIQQLVNAVKFLESQDVVHRDIKPENIHVSLDYNSLKLLDLGVARNYEVTEGESPSLTDQNNTRPFVATAQYSSPEYLFRLDEPSPKLWKGLNLYQVGAVLHDLIQKEPLFQHEMTLGNRWLVTKAVLLKMPTFKDGNPHRLTFLKSLALKCLSKDPDTRIALIDWVDFFPNEELAPLEMLKGLLGKGIGNVYDTHQEGQKLDFERNQYYLRFIDKIRDEMVAVCGTQVPLVLTNMPYDINYFSIYEFCVKEKVCLYVGIKFEWLSELYKSTARVYLSAHMSETISEDLAKNCKKLIFSVDLNVPNDVAVADTLKRIATILTKAIQLVNTSSDFSMFNNLDLLKLEMS